MNAASNQAGSYWNKRQNTCHTSLGSHMVAQVWTLKFSSLGKTYIYIDCLQSVEKMMFLVLIVHCLAINGRRGLKLPIKAATWMQIWFLFDPPNHGIYPPTDKNI
jgi:hypothetical protein